MQGYDLPELVDHAMSSAEAENVKGLTIFSQGNIMQMLEGEATQVNRIYQLLPLKAMQFNVIQLICHPVEVASLNHTAVGLSGYSIWPKDKATLGVDVFKLSVAEVNERVLDSLGKSLLMEFTRDHLR